MNTRAVSVMMVALAGAAQAATVIRLGDLPGSHGHWQQGETTLAAPQEKVRQWLTSYDQWPQLFPDIQSAQRLGATPDGRTLVRFRSRILDRTMTIRVREYPDLLAYDGEGPNVTTQGKIFIEDVGGGRTHVVMQTTAQVHGMVGIFATEGFKRDRALKKLRADLTALVHLAGG
jgi:carbon monoxide dehydrogenase subunit G